MMGGLGCRRQARQILSLPRRSSYAGAVTEADPLEIAAAQLAIDDLWSEDLPQVATDALVRGQDSPSLRLLASQSRSDVRDSADLFRSALHELSIEPLDAESAHWLLIRQTSGDIVAGRVDPIIAADRFRKSSHEMQDCGDLLIFVGLLSQHEDHPEDEDRSRDAIVAESSDLLSRAAPRVWLTLVARGDQPPLLRTATPENLPIDPSALPLSADLRVAVHQWAGDYQEALGDWPQRGGFESISDAERFVEQGARLVERLQFELGPTFYVDYFPEPIRPPSVKLKRSPWSRFRRLTRGH